MSVVSDVWTGCKFVSGGGLFPTLVPPGVKMTIVVRQTQGAFRPERAAREVGIDYSAFIVRSILIGQTVQWHASPAEDLFTAFRAPMDPLLVGLDMKIEIVNVSDEPLPFAVSFEGRVLR